MGAQDNKVFIISLDGATFDILRPLVAQGYMPNVGAMMEHGIAAELESVLPPVTAPAWTSFMTGKHPSKHAIFDFTRFDPATYSWSINNAQHIRSKTLWQILSEKGKRVVVLNLPYTYPTYEINGVMVAGWDAPAGEASFSYPAEVSAEILRMFPDYKTNLWVSEIMPLQSDGQFNEFTQKLKAGFEQQAKIALHMLEREPWDVFMVHFQQTDWIQHKLWKYIEQGCRDAADHSSKVEATRNCYKQFDEWVGLLLKQVPATKAVRIVLSDHGFGRLMGNIYSNHYLNQWGYLAKKVEAQDKLRGVKDLLRKSKHSSLRKLYRTLADAKNNIGSNGSGRKHQSWADNAGEVLSGRGQALDWSRTKVATVYAYQMGFLFVNLVGRGPQGIVKEGAEYDQLISDLIKRFRDVRHPITGEKLLQDVVRGSDVYPAADGIPLPDLILVPVDGYNFSFTVSDAPPEISEEGTHRHNGVVLMDGGGIARVPGLTPNLIDMAPSILHMAGLAVPSDMDGRVLEEILPLEPAVRYEEVDNSLTHQAQDYTGEEAELIEQRLKGLGYLE